ncbi:MAG: amidase [Pseudomonadota bacterium]
MNNSEPGTTERPGGDLNAWCDYPRVDVPHAETGPLAGKTLAVKDIYQVAGYKNGWGSPSRLAEAGFDQDTAPSVQSLLDAGANCIGKSQCDELCFSLNGMNAHYGSPINPADRNRITGGSSSGSVSLVASKSVDIATGSDTGGSVRAPAAYCGLVGLRTTHGRITLDKTMPLAHSYDVYGWFAHDLRTYEAVSDVMLGSDPEATPLSKAVSISILVQQLLGDHVEQEYSAIRSRVLSHFGGYNERDGFIRPIDDWYWCFRETQSFEAWGNLGEWIERSGAALGPGVKDRFELGKSISKERYAEQSQARTAMRSEIESLLSDDTVLVLPTVPGPAPLLRQSFDSLQEFREQALRLLCVSGISGLPQITIPLGSVDGAPFGISLIGPRHSDRRLVSLALQILADR